MTAKSGDAEKEKHMSTYTPNRGEKVRATLGKSTIVGIVRHGSILGVSLEPEGTDVLFPIYYSEGWKVERVWNIPTKPGALVRRKADGTLFTFVKREGRAAEFPWFNLTNGTFTDLASRWDDDRFIIEFGGVDQ